MSNGKEAFTLDEESVAKQCNLKDRSELSVGADLLDCWLSEAPVRVGEPPLQKIDGPNFGVVVSLFYAKK
jgi:hypothetical protein